MPLILLKDAAFAYEGHTVVKNLSFEVRAGDYLLVVGENGAGKSTLIKGLLGLLKPSEGSITSGEGLKLPDIGYLPQQQAAERGFPASVYEVVISGCLGGMGRRAFYGRAERDRAMDSLVRFDMAKLKNRCFSELSGGQQRRVLIARSLCAANRLLLLDEPAAGLDTAAAAGLYSLIARLNREGMGIIMVTHDIDAAIGSATHVLHLSAGGHFFGTAAEYAGARRTGEGRQCLIR